MKEPQKAIAASAKKKPLKSPVKPAKRPSKGNPTPVATRARKQPSKAKKEAGRNAVKGGVLGDLRPPLLSKIKRPTSTPHFNPFEKFYDRPNEYLAYGAFYLLFTQHWLKIQSHPLGAIKVLEDAIEDISQQKSAILIGWGVNPEEARKIVDSSHRAWLIQFSKKVWGSSNPEDFKDKQKDAYSERMRERAMVVSAKHDFDRLLKVLNSDLVRKSGSSIEAIFERTYRAIKESTTGLEAWKSDPNDWAQKIAWLWVAPPWGDANGKWPEKMPPVCMWSSDAIAKLLVDGEFEPSDAMVRQSIKRLGLCRPSHPVPTYGVSNWSKKISFVPRTRGRFDS
jgi:hypothetical protein